WRCEQLLITYEEEILAASFAYHTLRVEADPFNKTVCDRLHLDELRVHIIGCRLRFHRKRVGREPRPAGHADIHPVFYPFLAEILLPDPAWDVCLDRIWQRIDPKGAISAKDNRPQIAFLEPVYPNNIDAGRDDLLYRVAHRHAVDVARVSESPDVFAEPEDLRAASRRIASNPLEEGRRIVDYM